MSHTFRPVQWNRNKVVYDLFLVLGIALVIVVEFAVVAARVPAGEQPSFEILLLRVLGDTGFLLLNLILITGPLARLSEKFLPLLYNRRHMGVLFFLIVLVHGAFAIVWYHGFGPVDPFTSLLTSQGSLEGEASWRFQPLGFFALLIFLLMAATSHDYWNTVLGPVFWKSLHMSVYLAYALVIAHMALGPARSDHSALPEWAPITSVLLVALLHLMAAWKSRDGALSKAVRRKSNRKGWLEVPNVSDIAPGSARVIAVPGGERVAIFRNDAGAFGAISNVCRHQAGPLGEGCIVDGLVTCPWHGFQYRLEDGTSPPPFNEKVATYEMVAEGGALLLNPKPLPPGTIRPLVSLPEEGDA